MFLLDRADLATIQRMVTLLVHCVMLGPTAVHLKLQPVLLVQQGHTSLNQANPTARTANLAHSRVRLVAQCVMRALGAVWRGRPKLHNARSVILESTAVEGLNVTHASLARTVTNPPTHVHLAQAALTPRMPMRPPVNLVRKASSQALTSHSV